MPERRDSSVAVTHATFLQVAGRPYAVQSEQPMSFLVELAMQGQQERFWNTSTLCLAAKDNIVDD